MAAFATYILSSENVTFFNLLNTNQMQKIQYLIWQLMGITVTVPVRQKPKHFGHISMKAKLKTSKITEKLFHSICCSLQMSYLHITNIHIFNRQSMLNCIPKESPAEKRFGFTFCSGLKTLISN